MTASLDFQTLADLAGHRPGITDAPCPICGPDRRVKANQKRRVLRIWIEPGFASFHCARCGATGWAREDGAADIDPARLRQHRRKAAVRDRDRQKRQLDKARYLWSRRNAIAGSPAAEYLRGARRYRGPFPATLGFLSPSKPEHHPAMIAAFGIPEEPEPGVLFLADDAVMGIHLTLLKPDGSGKAGTDRDKIMVGPSSGWPIVLASMNDLLGLIACEGIETGLSLYEATGCGVWAAGSATRLPGLADKVPSYTDCVTIAGDPDPAGRAGTAKLAGALEVRGVYTENRFTEIEMEAA